ncbi:MAG TPA: Spy/CpxP family protein refolding chaperone [Pyrinomonadaceae bacterium]|nr:Spy/CpxP family protein refolding chaperone [Pyrinomonadaceae bacterium]
MRNRFAMTVLALALATAGVVYAGSHGVAPSGAAPTAHANATDDGPLAHPFARRVFARVASELKLTDAQQTEIKQIVGYELAGARPLFEKLKENRKQLREADAGGQFDEARVRAIAAEQGQTLSELIVARERAKAKILGILTPEQRERANELLEQFESRRNGPLPFAG